MLGLENLYIPDQLPPKLPTAGIDETLEAENQRSRASHDAVTSKKTFEQFLPPLTFKGFFDYPPGDDEEPPIYHIKQDRCDRAERYIRELDRAMARYDEKYTDFLDNFEPYIFEQADSTLPATFDTSDSSRWWTAWNRFQIDPLPSGRVSQNPRRLVLPAIINGIACDALPDTMSSANIMTKAHAVSIGAVIDGDASKRSQFKNACGIPFKSLGEVIVDVTFPGEPSKIWRGCRFAVVKKCAAEVIIGDAFLRATETLTRFRSRLKKMSISLSRKFWRICYTDTPLRRLSCKIGSHSVLVNADTGSDVDLVSTEYAKSRAWQIQSPPDDTGYVVLADGTVRKVAGYVDVPLTVADTTISNTFYVLDGLVCDVLLGDGTLEVLDVFNSYEDHFVETTFDDENGICHNINWQETIDRRLEQILRDDFPGWTAADLGKTHFNRIGFNFVSSEKNTRAWREAFDRALHLLDNREVTAQVRSQQAMAKLNGSELERAKRLELHRQDSHRQKANTIKQERDKFLGIKPSGV